MNPNFCTNMNDIGVIYKGNIYDSRTNQRFLDVRYYLSIYNGKMAYVIIGADGEIVSDIDAGCMVQLSIPTICGYVKLINPYQNKRIKLDAALTTIGEVSAVGVVAMEGNHFITENGDKIPFENVDTIRYLSCIDKTYVNITIDHRVNNNIEETYTPMRIDMIDTFMTRIIMLLDPISKGRCVYINENIYLVGLNPVKLMSRSLSNCFSAIPDNFKNRSFVVKELLPRDVCIEDEKQNIYHVPYISLNSGGIPLKTVSRFLCSSQTHFLDLRLGTIIGDSEDSFVIVGRHGSTYPETYYIESIDTIDGEPVIPHDGFLMGNHFETYRIEQDYRDFWYKGCIELPTRRSESVPVITDNTTVCYHNCNIGSKVQIKTKEQLINECGLNNLHEPNTEIEYTQELSDIADSAEYVFIRKIIDNNRFIVTRTCDEDCDGIMISAEMIIGNVKNPCYTLCLSSSYAQANKATFNNVKDIHSSWRMNFVMIRDDARTEVATYTAYNCEDVYVGGRPVSGSHLFLVDSLNNNSFCVDRNKSIREMVVAIEKACGCKVASITYAYDGTAIYERSFDDNKEISVPYIIGKFITPVKAPVRAPVVDFMF